MISSAESLIIPAAALALPIAAMLERLQSQAMREALAEPSTQAARARGGARPPRIGRPGQRGGRKTGQVRANPIVIATVDGKRYLVSMLGPGSDWVKNVDAAQGDAVIHQGTRKRVHLVLVPAHERAPVLREYVRIAQSGRLHFPVAVGAPLSEFEKIAGDYPVYRIDTPSSRASPSA